ncbi:unnamed protein product [Ceratitis capitata]|uniref:(Mediterranean fruit fly) hypothetical protein n=1 Tax=Ceratitis capitata TaxID=7213 RepID=A0A811UZU3_CERCA|nr:unnamed protein product [Ceratitis capitata]
MELFRTGNCCRLLEQIEISFALINCLRPKLMQQSKCQSNGKQHMACKLRQCTQAYIHIHIYEHTNIYKYVCICLQCVDIYMHVQHIVIEIGVNCTHCSLTPPQLCQAKRRLEAATPYVCNKIFANSRHIDNGVDMHDF